MNIPDFLEQCIEPKFSMKNANENIPLFEGMMKIRQSDIIAEGVGKIELRWLPFPRIQFDLQSEETELALPKFDPIEIEGLSNPTFISEGYLKRAIHADNIRFIGTLDGKHADDSLNCDLVKFHIPNFYNYAGEFLKYNTDGKNGLFTGRLHLHDRDWVVILDWVDNYKVLQKDLDELNGFALTHVGIIKKTGDRSFSAAEAKDFLYAMYYFLSFVRGAWCGPALSMGTLNDTTVWEPWDLNHTTMWIKSKSNRPNWFDQRNPKEIDNTFQNFMNKWRDPVTREKIQILIQWYVEANQLAGGIEGSLVLTHSALDHLSSTTSSKADADSRIRDFFTNNGIDIRLPKKLRDLFAIYHGNDTPKTLSMLRNELVHPINGSRRIPLSNVSQKAREEALDLGLWCIERALLQFFNHKGHYYNRTKKDYEVIQ